MSKPTTKKDKIKVFSKREIYRNFKVLYGRVNEQEYKIYTDVIFKTIIDYIVEGFTYYIPYKIGQLYVRRRNIIEPSNSNAPRKFIVNWPATYKLRREKVPNAPKGYWKRPENKQKYIVAYLNNERTGYYYFVKFKKSNDDIYSNSFITIFKFKVSNAVKKALSKYISNHKVLPSYYEK